MQNVAVHKRVVGYLIAVWSALDMDFLKTTYALVQSASSALSNIANKVVNDTNSFFSCRILLCLFSAMLSRQWC